MGTVARALQTPEQKIFRSKALKFAYLLSQNLAVSSKARDEILFLVDVVLASFEYQVTEAETLCVACVVFVLKFEDEFGSRFGAFISFVKTQLLIDVNTLRKWEVFVLAKMPDYFIHLPDANGTIKALLAVTGVKDVSSDLIDRIENLFLHRYIEGDEELSFVALLVDPVVAIVFENQDCSAVYEKLRAVFVCQHISLAA